MDGEHDPFDGLEEWARETEKRVRKEVGRAPRPPRPPRSEPGPMRSALLVGAVAVGAVALAAAVPGLRTYVTRLNGTAAAYPTESVPSGISVTTSEKAAPADPFAGTPAATYPVGAAGITLPAATKVDSFSAAQVRADLAKVRAELIAGRLDRRMLVDHRPDTFLAPLTTANRAQLRGWFTAGTFGGVATEIDPAVRLDPAAPPRVSGRVTYRSLRVNGIPTLEVTTNFVWVYAFTGVRHPLAAVHDQIVWEFADSARLRPEDRGMRMSETRSYGTRVDCAASAKGLLAPTRPEDEAAPGPAGSGNPDDYLRADHSLDIPDDCGTGSRPPTAVR